jgi:hypothetical protein
MSQVMNVGEVMAMMVPIKEQRLNIVQTPKSGNAYTANANVPESEFQQVMAHKADNVAASPADMGKRNNTVRGITQKQETYATIELYSGGEKPSLTKGTAFAEFLLQSVSEATEERYQLVETFGDTIGFFFGTRPKIYQYSGVLLNTADYAWRDSWKNTYESELRGTKCVDHKVRAYLTYDFVLREGYILGMNMGQMSANPNTVDFSFTMFITRELNLSPTDVKKLASQAGQISGAMEQRLWDKWTSEKLAPEAYHDAYMAALKDKSRTVESAFDVQIAQTKFQEKIEIAQIAESLSQMTYAETTPVTPTGAGPFAGEAPGASEEHPWFSLAERPTPGTQPAPVQEIQGFTSLASSDVPKNYVKYYTLPPQTTE